MKLDELTSNEETVPEITPAPEETNQTEEKFHEAIEKRKHDVDLLSKYAAEMIDAKRIANAEAKELREKYDALVANIEKEKREKELAEMSEIERLQALLADKENEVNNYKLEVKREIERQAESEFKHTLDKYGAKDQEYMKYKLEKHIDSMSDSEKSNFDLNSWLKETKRTNPDLFKGKEDKEVKNSGNLDGVTRDGDKRETRNDKIDTISKTNGDKKKAKEEFYSFLAKINRS